MLVTRRKRSAKHVGQFAANILESRKHARDASDTLYDILYSMAAEQRETNRRLLALEIRLGKRSVVQPSESPASETV